MKALGPYDRSHVHSMRLSHSGEEKQVYTNIATAENGQAVPLKVKHRVPTGPSISTLAVDPRTGNRDRMNRTPVLKAAWHTGAEMRKHPEDG